MTSKEWTIIEPSQENELQKNTMNVVQEIKNKIDKIEKDQHLQTLTKDIQNIAKSIEDCQSLLLSVSETQTKLLTNIKILKFDQEAIIKSMIEDGKDIVRHTHTETIPTTFKMLFPNIYDDEYSSKRNINRLIRTGHGVPFMPEHLHTHK